MLKKFFLAFIFIGLAFVFVACDKKSSEDVSVAMVCGIGSIDDKSFNQFTWEGIVRYAKDHDLAKENYTFANSSTKEDYIINLSRFADEKLGLVVATGYYFENSMNIVGEKYPNQNFLLIDAISKVDKNVLSVTFNTNEGSFLAGVAAALKANSHSWDKVGFLGGIDGVIVQSFEAGFVQGVKAINPNIKVVVEHADDFANPIKGQRIAAKMYDKGINIIFNVAGSTGNGLIKEAKKRAIKGQDVWVIGVDKDQYEEGIYDKNKSVILTSVLKRVDVATYDSIDLVKNKKFKGGHKIYGLKNKGVGLPKNNPNLKKEWMEIIKKYEDDIVSGKVIVPFKPARVQNTK